MEIGGSRPRSELRLEGVASEMERLAETIGCRGRISIRPEEIDHLIAVELVGRLDGQQLDERGGFGPFPVERRDRPTTELRSKAS
jgi:hypothetical protein